MMIVGTFIPEIEIWNLDSENCDPVAVLGSANDPENSKLVNKYKKHEKKSGISETTHTDAIMSLSLNPFQREYLASGSADKTVKIWDVEELAAKATYANLHDDKVQVVRWSSMNESILLSGGYDGKINVVDVRDDKATMTYQLDKAWKDIESADWHATSETNFIVTTEAGMLLGFDTRYFKAPIFEVKAHKKACSAAAFSPHCPNLLASVGTDQVCKLWDVNMLVSDKEKACIVTKNMS